jgi:hypothetical protein
MEKTEISKKFDELTGISKIDDPPGKRQKTGFQVTLFLLGKKQ